jgi:DNA-binding MarR family transcriptional regulator
MKQQEPSHLKSHLGFWLRTVSNQVSHSFARKLERSGATVAEWVLLREMYAEKDPFPPSRLAEITMLSRGAISKLVERLVSKGLVLREDSLGDRRFQQISLTKAGLNLVPKLAKLADENDEYFFGSLTVKEKDQLIKTLKKVIEKTGIKEVPTE